MLMKILGGFGVILVAFLAFVALRPDHYHVERSVAIQAPAEIVYAHLDDLRKWAAWSPWDNIDPNMKRTYQGPERGVGGSYAWQGNSEVGSGQMTITKAEPPRHITYKLEFREPMAGEAEATMSLVKEGEGTHEVTWAMRGENSFFGKLFGVFMNVDEMIGEQFDAGLQKLKSVTEEEAEKLRAEQARTVAAPEADAPAAQGTGE